MFKKKMKSWILFGKKYQDSKKPSADWGVLFWGVFCFSMEDHPYGETSSKGRSEAERKRKRDEEREDDVGSTPPGFGLVFVASETIGTRMFTQKERRISNVLTDCVEIVVSVIILRKMLGIFEWICYLWGELTLGIFAPLSLWGYGSTLCTLLWSHINVTTVFDGVKGLPPPCSVWMIGILHVPLKWRKHQVVSKGKSHENLGQVQGDLSPRCRRDDPMKRWLGIYDICIYRYIWGHMRYTYIYIYTQCIWNIQKGSKITVPKGPPQILVLF